MSIMAAISALLFGTQEQATSKTFSSPNLGCIFETVSGILNHQVTAWNRGASLGFYLPPVGAPMRMLAYPEQRSIVVLCGRVDGGPQSWPVLQATIRDDGSVHLHEGSYGLEYVVEVHGENLEAILGRVVADYMLQPS